MPIENIDDLVRRLIRASVVDNASLTPFLKSAKIISDQRDVAYGFEWLVHTAVATYLIDNEEELGICCIRVNKKNIDGKIPDLAFKYNGTETCLELKTVYGNSFSYCKSDVEKLSDMSGRGFIIACCYKNDVDKSPRLHNSTLIESQSVDNDFRIVIVKVNNNG